MFILDHDLIWHGIGPLTCLETLFIEHYCINWRQNSCVVGAVGGYNIRWIVLDDASAISMSFHLHYHNSIQFNLIFSINGKCRLFPQSFCQRREVGRRLDSVGVNYTLVFFSSFLLPFLHLSSFPFFPLHSFFFIYNRFHFYYSSPLVIAIYQN